MSSNIYVSLDEARKEVERRWQDVQLRKRVEDELGDLFWDSYKLEPRAHLGRCLSSPDNGFLYFWLCSHYLNISPVIFEFLGDKFVSFNEEKKGLGRLHLIDNNKKKIVVDVLDCHANEKKLLKDVKIRTGDNLVDFHHNLFKYSGFEVELSDKTDWFRSFNGSADYYYPFLCHFIAHGVLFETFVLDDPNEDEKEDSFSKKIIIPTIEKIYQKFGLNPLVVRLYPPNQNESEDFYWWTYPPNINKYLLDFAKVNNLSYKQLNN